MTAGRKVFLLGLFFSSITVLFWGMLPIALKLSGDFSDPITLTWLRFVVAGIILGLWQWQRKALGEFRILRKADWLRLFAAASFLIVNYTTFVWSLKYLLPGSAQLSFQVAPLFLSLGGVFFLKETIHWKQWLCFGLIGLGMVIFFHPVFGQANQGSIWIGFLIVQVSAVCWSMYALLQKSLFRYIGSSNIFLAIYAYAAVVMLPFTSPSSLVNMTTQDTWIAAFCCLNTLIAYGAFAQAMRYWQTVQVSASVTLAPVTAFILTELCVANHWWTDRISSSHADFLSLFGMFMVVASAIGVQVVSMKLQHSSQKVAKQKKVIGQENVVEQTV